MKIAVLGSQGQLGKDLVPRLSGEVIALTRAEIDLDRPETLGSLRELRPDLVVNCAAYNFVDKAETARDDCFRVNAWGAGALAVACREINARLIHISTDYVFGLETARSEPFRETDAPGPVSLYGLSKLTGEFLVRSASPANLVIRTCGLYGVWGSGGKGGNFVETMLRIGGQGKPLRVVNDQFCTPTFTTDLAEAIVGLIRRQATDLVHVTSGGQCTWSEFASEIFKQAGLSVDLTPITSAEFGAPARRPCYSVLSMERLRDLGVAAPRPWPEALAQYLRDRTGRR